MGHDFDEVYGILIAPGEMGGFGISFKDLDECNIDDMVYLFKRHQIAARKIEEDIENAKN